MSTRCTGPFSFSRTQSSTPSSCSQSTSYTVDFRATPLQVFPYIVNRVIQSFPNGSAAGSDGLRPQHREDLIVGAADDNPQLVAIVDLANLLLKGKTPLPVRGVLFGATLLAIVKKQGGNQPIVVGYVWRRLAAKVACNHVKVACSSLLAPRQLGFGVSGGAKAAVFEQRDDSWKTCSEINCF